MNAILTIARKEFKDGLRNRWVIAITVLLAVFALSLSLLGSAPTGATKANPVEVTVVSLASLSIFLLPLIALLLSYDAIVGDVERGTMALLLSYPLARWQVVLGKYLGQLLILAVATVVGYGIAALGMALWQKGIGWQWAVWQPYVRFIGSSVLLGAAFLAMGYLLSALVRERATAAGLSIGVWLLFVLIYDLLLLGILVADKGQHVSAQMLDIALLVSPADAYRILNLSGGSATLSGMLGMAGQSALQPFALLASLAIWTAAPLMLAIFLFQRRNL
ncbi:MAG: ABC transporter permease [Cardiobacteriaceae bacterium]|nr:ABC transporter permease [Cardiobacteriaceae bacterium]